MGEVINPAQVLDQIRATPPLVHHITNVVTVASCADITIAIGASPVMAESPDEAADMAAFAQALVLNMGTLNRMAVSGMLLAGKVARDRGIPIVFDPVGAGATPFRRETALQIMTELRPDIVKGNRAEITFLAGGDSQQRGVDSLDANGDEAMKAVVASAARRWQTVMAATGIVDLIGDGQTILSITGGDALLGRITGTGCMTASLVGSVAALCPDRLVAAATGILVMNRAGEIAAAACGANPGTGDFRRELMNAVSRFRGDWLKFSERVVRAAA